MAEGEVAVILEDLRGQFKVFGEALTGLGEKMDQRFERVDQRLDKVDQRLDKVDQRLDQVDQRLDRLDRRADGTEGKIGLLQIAVLENSREVRELRRGVEEAMAKKVDRDEVEGVVESVVERVLARRDRTS